MKPVFCKSFQDLVSKRQLRAGVLSVLGCACVLASIASCNGQTLTDQVAQKVIRLRAILPIAEDFRDQRPQIESYLGDVEQAAKDGQTYFVLYRLQSWWTSIEPFEYAKRAGATIHDKAAFEREWRALASRLKAKEAEIDRANPGKAPLAIRALVQICLIRSRMYYQSSRPYAEDTALSYGFYYMGAANSELDFALFCLGQDYSSQPQGPDVHSVTAALDALDAKVTATYKQRDSPKLVEDFIAINSSIELARQLESAGMNDGALVAYLDTWFRQGLIDQTSSSDVQIAELTHRLGEIDSRLKSSRADNSVAMIYTAAARRALAHVSAGEDAGENLKKATSLIDRVLPAYFSYFSESKA